MSKIFPFDARVVEALAKSSFDFDEAAHCLLLAAEYLRNGKQMPQNLVDHLAGAIEASMNKPQKSRGKAFLQELKLSALNARAKGDYYFVGRLVEDRLNAGDSFIEAAAEVMADPSTKIKSQTTVKKLHKQYLAAKAEHDKTI